MGELATRRKPRNDAFATLAFILLDAAEKNKSGGEKREPRSKRQKRRLARFLVA